MLCMPTTPCTHVATDISIFAYIQTDKIVYIYIYIFMYLQLGTKRARHIQVQLTSNLKHLCCLAFEVESLSLLTKSRSRSCS